MALSLSRSLAPPRPLPPPPAPNKLCHLFSLCLVFPWMVFNLNLSCTIHVHAGFNDYDECWQLQKWIDFLKYYLYFMWINSACSFFYFLQVNALPRETDGVIIIRKLHVFRTLLEQKTVKCCCRSKDLLCRQPEALTTCFLFSCKGPDACLIFPLNENKIQYCAGAEPVYHMALYTVNCLLWVPVILVKI